MLLLWADFFFRQIGYFCDINLSFIDCFHILVKSENDYTPLCAESFRNNTFEAFKRCYFSLFFDSILHNIQTWSANRMISNWTRTGKNAAIFCVWYLLSNEAKRKRSSHLENVVDACQSQTNRNVRHSIFFIFPFTVFARFEEISGCRFNQHGVSIQIKWMSRLFA